MVAPIAEHELPEAVLDGLRRVERAQTDGVAGDYRQAVAEALVWREHTQTHVGWLDDVVFIPDWSDARPWQFIVIIGVVAIILGIGVALDLSQGDPTKTALATVLVVGGAFAIARQRQLQRSAEARPRRFGHYLFDDRLVTITSWGCWSLPRHEVVRFEVNRRRNHARLEAILLKDGQTDHHPLKFPGLVGGLQSALEQWRAGGVAALTRAIDNRSSA